MPNEDRCFSITFPEDTSVSFPSGSIVSIPGTPPFNLAEGIEAPFQAGMSVTFPASNNLVVTPPGQPPINLDPNGGTISIPGAQPFQLVPLSDAGLGIAFPPGTKISFSGHHGAGFTLSAHFVVRLRRVAEVSVSPRRTDA
ncbi:MAG: hypothetical protein HYX43_12770 [Burkholderiales bacterium]|nr:hypothetical protein [Burkholderiales bacterium]